MSMKSGMLVALLSISLLACSGGGEAPTHATEPHASSEAETQPVQSSASTEPAADPERVPSSEGASPADACAAADTQLTDARVGKYSTLVANSIRDDKVRPDEVTIHGFMRSGTWSTVFASIPIADPGFFLFETVDGDVQFRDIWAGLAEEDDRAGLIDWARSLGALEKFASCFAQTVIG